MIDRKREDERFYDLCYDEWRRGHNMDDLSWDRFDGYLADGFEPDEISLAMMCPHRRES